EKNFIVCVKADGKNITIDPLGRKIINGTVDLGTVTIDRGSVNLIAAGRLVSSETQNFVKAYFRTFFGSKVSTRKEFDELLATKVQDAITARLQKGIVTIPTATGPAGQAGPSISKAQIIAIAGAPGARGFRGFRGFRGARGRHGPRGKPGLAAIVGADGRVQWMSENKARTMLFSGHGTAAGVELRGRPISMSGPRAQPKKTARAAQAAAAERRNYHLKTLVIAPNITSKPNETVIVSVGSKVSLSTKVRGVPTPDNFWINEATSRVVFGNYMIIKNATVKDSGTWTFKAKNVLGTASTQVELLVAIKPRFTKGQVSQKVAYQKMTTKVECPVEGHPKPKIEWARHGNAKMNPAHHTVIHGDLYIKNPTIKEQGMYVCRATNVLGFVVGGTRVFVQRFVALRAKTLMPAKIAVKDVSKPLQLDCSAFGNPPPNITWHKDGKALKSKNYVKPPQQRGQLPLYISELVIKQISSKDEGTYTCSMNTSMMSKVAEYRTTISLYKCSELHAPLNGIKVGNDRSVGACVKFACDPGCMLYGSQIRVCNKHGKWTGTPPVCYDVGEVAFECHHYNILTDPDRNINSRKIMGKCDQNLATGWYRIGGEAGRQMPTSCQAGWRCNVQFPGWLYGQHPRKEDGCIQTHVCFGDSKSNCCAYKQPVLVRNCGTFYVYKFSPTKGCNMRYCTMG
ncbi:hypothetical protein QZH41_010578, partial [Actinostola sp. cb2023]